MNHYLVMAERKLDGFRWSWMVALMLLCNLTTVGEHTHTHTHTNAFAVYNTTMTFGMCTGTNLVNTKAKCNILF